MNKLYNRELSWLQFNDRVLQEARDESVPLMQRLRFLGIFSNNQDEFVRVRVANLIRYAAFRGKNKVRLSGGYTASELLPLINARMESSQGIFQETFSHIIAEMEGHGVHLVDETMLSEHQHEFCRKYFSSVISPRLVPLILRKSIDLPLLPDYKIYLAVKMVGAKQNRYAILQMPVSDASPRFVVLPSDNGRTDVIFIDDIIRLFLDEVFFMFNYESISAYTFKMVRDAEFTLDDDVSKSMLENMMQALSKRERGRPVRLIYDMTMPGDMLKTLADKLVLKAEQLQSGGRYHLMRDLMRFPRVLPELEETDPKPLNHPFIDPFKSILKEIRRQDILLCYPYQSFSHFIDLLREAAVDPRVQSISITLYRTAVHSKVLNALLNAVRNGKQVTALVELKARFDEEHNIDNAALLLEGGVKVVYSLDSLKVHSKLLLVERKEGSRGTRGYVYVGTGNFNEDTTRIYSDFGLMTYDQTMVEDARRIFDFLQNTHRHPVCRQLVVSPYYMRDHIGAIINNEIKSAKKGKKAYFYGKFNSLTDEKIITLLYAASAAGVEVKLIVRGTCCLQAGVEGLSERIEVRSIVDRYLEHARMIIACNGGKPKSWIMSADLMSRNLDSRVEVGIPIYNANVHYILEEYFRIQWEDNVKARLIAPPFENGYVPVTEGEPRRRSQVELYNFFSSMLNPPEKTMSE